MMHPLVPRGLGGRLALALAVALLPLGIVAALQTRSLMREAQARSEAALLGETLLAAVPETALIRGARVTASALAASMMDDFNNAAECAAKMRRVIDGAVGAYSFAAFVPPSGDVRCTSNGKPLDLTKSERLAVMRGDPQPDTAVIRNGVASGTSVLAFGHPVLDPAGAFQGYVSISMPHSILEGGPLPDDDLDRRNRLEAIALITFDIDGNILTSTTGLEDASSHLPRNVPLSDLTADRARTFAAVSSRGVERVYAVFPLVEGRIFTIGSWPVAVMGGPLSFPLYPYLLPALMWLASLVVALLAAERVVTRHIRALRASITAFASGNRKVRELDLPDAAEEIREVGEAYLKMTDTILHDEAELEDMVHQREVLLREVHHRVKNNLQLIASIMNMQMRQAHSVEAKTLMKNLQDRVMALATIHRGLYQTTGLTDVRADELLSDILRQLVNMATGPGRRLDVTSGFDELRLTPDQAVPLSLLLTEAVTNAMKYASAPAGMLPRLAVTLRRDDEKSVVLTISNSLDADRGQERDAASPAGTGLGTQLLTAFAQQVGASLETVERDGMYHLFVTFEPAALTAAEVLRDEQNDAQPLWT